MPAEKNAAGPARVRTLRTTRRPPPRRATTRTTCASARGPASHAHSNGGAGTTQTRDPSTKNSTASAPSAGVTSARSRTRPASWACPSGSTMVSTGSA